MSEHARVSVARNPKATHDYFILETIEAGLVLRGTEVKSLRAGKASIKEAWALVKQGELWLEGMNITPYEQGNRWNHQPLRTRKLLLHRREIERLIGALEREGRDPRSARALLPQGQGESRAGPGQGQTGPRQARVPQASGSPSAKCPAPWHGRVANDRVTAARGPARQRAFECRHRDTGWRAPDSRDDGTRCRSPHSRGRHAHRAPRHQRLGRDLGRRDRRDGAVPVPAWRSGLQLLGRIVRPRVERPGAPGHALPAR